MEIGRRLDSTLQVTVLILAIATLCVVNMAFGDTASNNPATEVKDTFKENQIRLYDAL